MAHDSPAGLSSVRARGGGALPLSHRQGGRRAEFVWRQRGSGGVVCGGGLLPARGQGPAAVHGRRSSRLHQQGHQRGHPREGARRSGGRRAPPVSALLSAVRPVPHPTLFLALCSPPLLPALKLYAPNGALSLHTHTLFTRTTELSPAGIITQRSQAGCRRYAMHTVQLAMGVVRNTEWPHPAPTSVTRWPSASATRIGVSSLCRRPLPSCPSVP